MIRSTSISVALALLLAACSSGGFDPPATLDSGAWEIVDRTVENELMAQATASLASLGLEESFGAAYEFLTYKPQFFFGMGRGSADPQAVIDAALPHFGGTLGTSEPPREVRRDGVTYLCAPYTHQGVPGSQGGSSLVSIAAVCGWSDEGTSGFGVTVAGLSVEDTADMSSEARAEVVA